MKRLSLAAFAAVAVGTLLAVPSFAAGPGFKIVKHIKMPDGDFDYGTIDSAKGRVFWARDGQITMFNVKTGQITELVGGPNGHAAVPVPGTDLIVESHGVPSVVGPAAATSGIAVIDIKANKIVADIPAGRPAAGAPKGPPTGFPDGATYDPASKLVYVMTHFDAIAYAVNPRTRKLVAQVAVGTKDQESPAADGKGHLFITSPGSKEISVVDTKTQKVTGHYPLSCGASGLAYASRSNLLIAECDDDGLAEVVDAKTGKTVASVTIGHGADSVQYDAKDQLAMIPCQEEGKLYVISVGNPKHVALVQTADSVVGTRTGAWDENTDHGYYMAGKSTGKRVHGHLILQPGTLEMLVVAK